MSSAKAAARINLPALIERGKDLNQVLLKAGDIVRVTPRDDSKIFVMGEVTTPTVAVMRDGRMSLNEALGLAGGPSQLNSDPSQVFVVRSTEEAKPLVFHLNAASPQARGGGEIRVAAQRRRIRGYGRSGALEPFHQQPVPQRANGADRQFHQVVA